MGENSKQPTDCARKNAALQQQLAKAGAKQRQTEQQRDQLLAALCLALPFVEDHECDNGYKPGSVAKAVKTIREAIAAVEQQCNPAA